MAASVMFRIPCGPPTNGFSQFDEIRIDTISPRPNVTIAR